MSSNYLTTSCNSSDLGRNVVVKNLDKPVSWRRKTQDDHEELKFARKFGTPTEFFTEFFEIRGSSTRSRISLAQTYFAGTPFGGSKNQTTRHSFPGIRTNWLSDSTPTTLSQHGLRSHQQRLKAVVCEFSLAAISAR